MGDRLRSQRHFNLKQDCAKDGYELSGKSWIQQKLAFNVLPSRQIYSYLA